MCDVNTETFPNHPRCLAREEHLTATGGARYWGGAGRWDQYISQVAALVEGRWCGGSEVLEIGPLTVPIVHDSQRMDIEPQCERCIAHDALDVPWPFAAKQFDIVIACQVWGHLGPHLEDGQRNAFQEAKRVGRALLLTLPWKWYKGDIEHQAITEDVINHWSKGERPVIFRLLCNNRALFLWEFESTN